MLQYRGDTEYITRLERECEIVKKRLLSREKVIGFGCQWKGANKIGVIEIATPCTVYIFHVGAYKDRMTCNDEDDDDNNNNNNNNNTHSDGSDDEAKTNKKKLLHHKKKTVPSFLKCGESMFNLSGNNADIHLISHELRYLLESADYLKVGVNIHGDFMKLSADFDIQYDPHSILDLGAFYNTKLSLMEHWNVLSLCEQLLNGDVDRSNDIAKSEWSEFPLDDEQMRYCQETAYFALKLFFKIHSIKDNNDEESSQNEDYLTYNGIQENEYKDGYDLEYTFKDMQDDQDATDDEYDHDFDAIIMGKKLTNDIDISQIYASPINTNVRHNESDYFANIMCDDSPLISFMSPFNRHNDMEQIGKTSENTSTSLTQCGSSLKPMNLMGIIDKQSESAILIEDDVKSDCIEITDIMETQNHFLPKIRSVEVKHYRQMDCILSYWMWSWSDFIFPNRKMKDIEQQYMIHATGNVNKNTLSLKKKEVYKCFDDFGMDFDAIIECRGYALSYKQIEMFLSDVINLGYKYNWKHIHDSVLKTSKYLENMDDDMNVDETLNLHKTECGLNLFYIDLIMLQMKVIELIQKQLNDIFAKYPLKKQEILSYYDGEGLNPKKLQRRVRNEGKNKQHLTTILPTDYEDKLKKVKVIYDDIWMLIKLKPLMKELIQFFLKQEEIHQDNVNRNDKECMKIDLFLLRYSLIRIVVFHIKRVVWMKHFIFH